MQIREINSISQLVSLHSDWHRLLQHTDAATFFQTPEWFEVYWRFFGENQRLRLLVVEQGGELVGIIPFVVTSESRRCGRVRVLTYPLDDWGTRFGPISADPDACLMAAVDHFQETRRDWDVLSLRWMPAEQAQSVAAESAANGIGFYSEVRQRIGRLNLPADWNEYLSQRTSKYRNNLRRAIRRIEEEFGTPNYLRYRPEPGSQVDWQLYDACDQVARNSWQAESTTGSTLCHASVEEFLRATHEVAVSLGAADVNLLYVNDEPIAFGYNYVFQNEVYGLRTGYHADWHAYAVGGVMLARMLEDGVERGDALYDLGPGTLEYKQRAGAEVFEIMELNYYCNVAPKAQVMRLKHIWDHWRAAKGV